MARRGNGGLVGKLNISGNDTATGVWTQFEQLHIKSNSNSSGAINSTATYWPRNGVSVNYLVIAGGGAGGGSVAGGGGAGGYQTGNVTVYSGTSYTVTVGAGGPGPGTNQAVGSSGSNSVFSSITSRGGGYGGSAVNAQNAIEPAIGGSGGGGSNYNSNSPSVSGGAGAAGVAGQGNSGGGSAGYGSGGNVGEAGGGGGGASRSSASASIGPPHTVSRSGMIIRFDAG